MSSNNPNISEPPKKFIKSPSDLTTLKNDPDFHPIVWIDCESGLTKKVVESEQTLKQVEQELYDYILKYTNPKTAVLAGNSVHMDRAFMMREMPKVLDHLHYRIIDVSTLTEISRRHNKTLLNKLPPKKGAHTARADILESIEQLKWYQDNYLKSPEDEK
ncbi:Oligoribonuclease [Wickerhamomyces ciferrii]|uniref:Oligoribonuclease n=1 Tax=Wickerhamomyces ciferrii (strain ATCC 14091 / BCRC 22168 / CBS 111 / JCM 3599 / NBRC 0793 / NRRL Y-1031 F-60-10) TaxID=1206466 RepID=K0KPZ9_WICCF|nr:Oligoribonuclease [Wickerhamomyces ciferrii]CCH43253.1 Oligoribonuclease [Wickerhamomyces ciferrii]